MNGTQLKRQEYIRKKYEGGQLPSYKDIMKRFGVAENTAFKDLRIFKKSLDGHD